MAALSFARSARVSLFHLPPAIRVATYQSSISRSFSATTVRKVDLVDVVTTIPFHAINGIHNLGIPWYAALPTAAVLVRGVLVYYLSTKPARQRALIQANLVPLAAATRLSERRLAEPPPPTSHPAVLVGYRTKLWLHTANRNNMLMHQIGKRFRAPKFSPRGLLNLFMLVTFTETVRQKCSSSHGLLPLILSPFQKIGDWISSGSAGQAVQHLPPTLTLEQRIQHLLENGQVPSKYGEPITFSAVEPSALATAATPTHGPLFDPSLQTEGLSWCPDLTAADPSGILPVALGLSLAANAILRPRNNRQARKTPSPVPPTATTLPPGVDPDSPEGRTLAHPHNFSTKLMNLRSPFVNFTNGERIQLLIAFVFTFAASSMPAAILLYFVPSVFVGWLQGRWLDWRMPIRPPIQPCKRPLYVRMRKRPSLG